MKKVLSLTLVILLMIPIFSGCGGKKESPSVSYTTEILINKETPPEDLVWYVDLDAPTAGNFIVEIPSYSTFATLDTTKIMQTARRDYRDIIDAKAPFHDTFFDKVTFFFSRRAKNKKHNYKLKILGMTEEEFDRKISKYLDLNDFHYYPDRVIGVIYPIIFQGETEELGDAEYSNKNILVDYDYETSVVIAYTDEELKAESNGMYSSNYTGRIGDRYYLPYGYYDLTNRILCPYKDENDLPPFNGLFGIKNNFDLLNIIRNDASAGKYIPDFHYIDSYILVGDRYYAVIRGNNRYYGNNIDDYEGENVFLVTIDAATGDVLYLQKFHLENYWGYEYKLCSLGEDGIMYDVMVP